MESVNKSFDVNEVFAGVEKSLEKYESVDSGNILEDLKLFRALSVKVISGLTDVLKNVLSKLESEGPKKTETPIGFASLLIKSAMKTMVHYGILPNR